MHCKIARESIENWITSGTKFLPTHRFHLKAGCFVTLHLLSGELKGCIGTIEPLYSDLALEIAENARSSATHDHRFSPVEIKDLTELKIEVSVLGKPEPIEKHTDLNPKIFGVIVEHSGRRGVLLPDLEGVTTIDQQISIAKHKAFISAKEPVKIWRFKVEKYSEMK